MFVLIPGVLSSLVREVSALLSVFAVGCNQCRELQQSANNKGAALIGLSGSSKE